MIGDVAVLLDFRYKTVSKVPKNRDIVSAVYKRWL